MVPGNGIFFFWDCVKDWLCFITTWVLGYRYSRTNSFPWYTRLHPAWEVLKTPQDLAASRYSSTCKSWASKIISEIFLNAFHCCLQLISVLLVFGPDSQLWHVSWKNSQLSIHITPCIRCVSHDLHSPVGSKLGILNSVDSLETPHKCFRQHLPAHTPVVRSECNGFGAVNCVGEYSC